MENRDKIKILREIRDKEENERKRESLNWAIKVCDKYESQRESKKKRY